MQPDTAYVPYTPQNLEAQIQHYLAHPRARERIAQQGQKAIQSCHYSARFGALLALLQASWNPQEWQAQKLPPAEETDDFLLAHALVHMTSDLAVLRADAARQLARRSETLPVANALLVTLTDLWVHPTPHEALPTTTLEEVQASLETQLFSGPLSAPVHMLVAYNLAWSYFFQARYIEVERLLLHLQTLIETLSWQAFGQALMQSFFVLPVRYTGLYLLYQEAAAVGEDELQRMLRAGIVFLQGSVLRSRHKNREAIACFERCVGFAPRLAEAYFELAGAWLSQREYLKAEQCLAQGLYQGVCFKSAWKKYFQLLDRRTLSPAEQAQKARLLQALRRLSLDPLG